MQQPRPPQVFVSHASPEKDNARDIVRRLASMGFVTWFDEQELSAGDAFPVRLRHALDSSTHLLVLLTPAWLAATWTHRELEVFVAPGEERRQSVVPLLPDRIDRAALPELLRERTLVEMPGLESDQVDWLLFCAITRTTAGPRDRWAQRARQTREERGEVPEFTPADLLSVAERLLVAPPPPGPLARNVALHCLRDGLSPAWIEPCSGAEALSAMYGRALLAVPERDRSAIWARLALVATRAGERPAGLTEERLIDTATTSSDEIIAVAALRLLALAPLSDRAVHALTRWLDPDTELDGPPLSTHPQTRGHTAAVDAALAVLFEQPGVDPTHLFRGYGSATIGETAWWVAYYRRLIQRAQAGRLAWNEVAERVALGVRWAETEPEQLAAICEALGELPALPPRMERAVQAALNALRHRRRDPWVTPALRLCELLLERVPRVVFLRLGASLMDFARWDEAHRAARVTGMAAQEVEDVEELLDRLPHAAHPEEQALLFEAALGSPADVADVAQTEARVAEAAGVLGPTTQAVATLLNGPLLRRLQAAVESDAWRTEAVGFLRAQPPIARELWPYVLGREYAHDGDDPAACWAGLLRCVRLLAQDIAAAAAPFIDAAEERASGPFLALDEEAFVDSWDQATGVVLGLGADLTARADALQAQLRWLQTGLRAAGPGALRGKLRLLDGRLRAWFTSFPDLARPLTSRPAVTFRYAVTTDAVWVSLRVLLEDEEVLHALSTRVYPRLSGRAVGASGADDLTRAVRAFALSDAARSVAHRLVAVDELLGWGIRLLRDHPLPEATGVLWALLQRKHGCRSPARPDREQHADLIAAIARAYEGATEALRETLAGLVTDPETRSQLALEAYRTAPRAAEGWILDELVALHEEPAAESLLIDGLDALCATPPSERALPLLRSLVDEAANASLAAAAGAALLATSAADEDTVRALRIATRHAAAAYRIGVALDARLRLTAGARPVT